MKKAEKENIREWIDTLNTFNSTPEYGTTRVLFTEPEVAGRAYVMQLMRQAGLEVTQDGIGNIFGTLKGENPEKAPVWTGSHIDTVLNAGKFDGMAGVMAGIEALRLIRESGIRRERDLMVVVYTSEEPTRFGACCLGSKAMAGMLTREDAKKLLDQDGKSLYQVLEELHYDTENFEQIVKKPGDVYGAVELHIEQNNRLERAGLPIGIVTKICAPSSYKVQIHGKQSHAGGTSMQERRDAFMACCELSLALENIALTTESEYSTGTVGYVKVVPGAENVIPGYVEFTVDMRDCSKTEKDKHMRRFEQLCEEVAQKRGVSIEYRLENDDTPVSCDDKMVETLASVCKEQQVPYQKMISGAYHDSMIVGTFAPVAMIFVPSRDGISHSPEEWTDFEDIATGTDILAETLVRLSNE